MVKKKKWNDTEELYSNGAHIITTADLFERREFFLFLFFLPGRDFREKLWQRKFLSRHKT